MLRNPDSVPASDTLIQDPVMEPFFITRSQTGGFTVYERVTKGENNTSYHRGDVWYWVNNLVGVVLQKFDCEKYSQFIESLTASSVFAISWQGTAGCLAEISSAVEQTSEGCISQAWSYALLLELLQSRGSK